MIPTLTVTRYLTPLREGGSLPAIVQADDGHGPHAIKFTGLQVSTDHCGLCRDPQVALDDLFQRLALRAPWDESLLRGLALGFAIAAPVGPIGVLCIRRTLAHGRLAGPVRVGRGLGPRRLWLYHRLWLDLHLQPAAQPSDRHPAGGRLFLLDLGTKTLAGPGG